MKKNDKRALIVLAFIPIIATSLFALSLRKEFDGQPPHGFAPYTGWKALLTRELRSVSSDGVMFRVRSENNTPKADLPFWREALKKRMLDAGYAFVSDADIKTGDKPGYLLELAAPMGAHDYSFLVAAFVQGDDIIIAEAAGEVTRVTKHRGEIVAAFSALVL